MPPGGASVTSDARVCRSASNICCASRQPRGLIVAVPSPARRACSQRYAIRPPNSCRNGSACAGSSPSRAAMSSSRSSAARAAPIRACVSSSTSAAPVRTIPKPSATPSIGCRPRTSVVPPAVPTTVRTPATVNGTAARNTVSRASLNALDHTAPYGRRQLRHQIRGDVGSVPPSCAAASGGRAVARLPANCALKIEPRTATPTVRRSSETPSPRRSAQVLVVATEFWTARTSTCIAQPSPSPSTNM